MELLFKHFRRTQVLPPEAQCILKNMPKSFSDDGCTFALDSLFGFDFRWACGIHNWRYCTRAHDPIFMTYKNKKIADRELRRNIRLSLPFFWKPVTWIYYVAVFFLGGFGAWNSCGPEVGPTCRHNLKMPKWMRDEAKKEKSSDTSSGSVVSKRPNTL